MRKIFWAIILILSIILYLIAINFISNINLTKVNYESSGEKISDEKDISVSDSVSVSVFRSRFYGKIVESNDNSKLYLFWFIPVPLKSKGVSFVKFHIILLSLILLIILFFIILKICKIIIQKSNKEVKHENFVEKFDYSY